MQMRGGACMLMSRARCGRGWEPSGSPADQPGVAPLPPHSSLGPYPPGSPPTVTLIHFPSSSRASAPGDEYLHSWFPCVSLLPPQTPRPPAARPRGPGPAC